VAFAGRNTEAVPGNQTLDRGEMTTLPRLLVVPADVEMTSLGRRARLDLGKS
jgi:hypothetical protein